VDISNAHLEHYGVDPVYPFIQAEGKSPLSSSNTNIFCRAQVCFLWYQASMEWRSAPRGAWKIRMPSPHIPGQTKFEDFCSATLAYKVSLFVVAVNVVVFFFQ
jgi:hypothetical protein